jgi:hypothetical protein
MTFALALYTLFGHAFLWIGLVNRLHAIALPRWIIDLFSTVMFAVMGAGGLLIFVGCRAAWVNPLGQAETALADRA